jgi:hypothetical protein
MTLFEFRMLRLFVVLLQPAILYNTIYKYQSHCMDSSPSYSVLAVELLLPPDFQFL